MKNQNKTGSPIRDTEKQFLYLKENRNSSSFRGSMVDQNLGDDSFQLINQIQLKWRNFVWIYKNYERIQLKTGVALLTLRHSA